MADLIILMFYVTAWLSVLLIGGLICQIFFDE